MPHRGKVKLASETSFYSATVVIGSWLRDAASSSSPLVGAILQSRLRSDVTPVHIQFVCRYTYERTHMKQRFCVRTSPSTSNLVGYTRQILPPKILWLVYVKNLPRHIYKPTPHVYVF